MHIHVGLVGFYCTSTIIGYLMSNPSYTLNSSILNNSVYIRTVFCLHTVKFETVLLLTIQFRTSTKFSSICPIDRILSGAITPNQKGPGSDGNKGIRCIPQSSSITGASSSDYLVSYPGYLLQRCRRCILLLQPTGPIFKKKNF